MGITIRYCRNCPLPVKLRPRSTANDLTPLHIAIFSSSNFGRCRYRYIEAAISVSDCYLNPWPQVIPLPQPPKRVTGKLGFVQSYLAGAFCVSSVSELYVQPLAMV